MENQPSTQITATVEIVKAWKLNKVHLASKMGVNAYTFKMKLLGKPNYTFTETEIDLLTQVLKELATDIENACGISFNKALAGIVRKKV